MHYDELLYRPYSPLGLVIMGIKYERSQRMQTKGPSSLALISPDMATADPLKRKANTCAASSEGAPSLQPFSFYKSS